MTIPTITLAGKQVGKVGLGLMQLTWSPSPPPEEEAFAAMKAAADAGATTWSTATFYGNGAPGEKGPAFDNLRLLGRFFKAYPEYVGRIQLVVKGGIGPGMDITSDPDMNRSLLSYAGECLGVPIDVYLPARMRPGADPVSFFRDFDTLRQEGLFGALGASEISAPTLARIVGAGIPISVVEIEVSLWSWDADVRAAVDWSTANNVPVYAYSPLGRGFLTRTWKRPEDVPAESFQGHSPRFQGDNFYKNLQLVDMLDSMAAKRGISTAQLALAWVCAAGPYVVPIPGSKSVERVRQNTEAANITLSAEEMAQIEEILSQFPPSGARYPASHSVALML
ncbi:hypothetical protein CspeluHIS016_0207990 [Cutaneotrichosporon spelunceum]|uniref:NADP-dependent oxidoreductase domain-containing protein n=1 Tax=Cutaneotrichosporon spelunceum TaxID=1672016 RepID=A0AAD3TSA3_9TREE|nr:hypothetical protein CspeluHIS016_0207990 [Cutaneotrichosporon spelunceum]